MWEDKWLYWAWRGSNYENYTPPPTTKIILYKTMDAGNGRTYKEAFAVIDEPNVETIS